jgi:hypothetical protein
MLISVVTSVGWIAGAVYADMYVGGLDRGQVCVNTGVALGDTVLRSVERARRDSAALADRNCTARYTLARQGRAVTVRTGVVLVAFLSALVTSSFTLRWMLRRARGRPREP